MIKFRDLFRRQKAGEQLHVQATPSTGASHEHKFIGMPCDMGRKIYRVCQVSGCNFSETVSATVGQQAATAPLADAVRSFQNTVMSDVERELEKRGKRR